MPPSLLASTFLCASYRRYGEDVRQGRASLLHRVYPRPRETTRNNRLHSRGQNIYRDHQRQEVRYSMTRSQGLVTSLYRNSQPVAELRFGFIGRNIMGGETPPPGHPTSGPSLPSMAEPLPRKERDFRPRTFYPSTAFLLGTRSVQLEKNQEANCLSSRDREVPKPHEEDNTLQRNCQYVSISVWTNKEKPRLYV